MQSKHIRRIRSSNPDLRLCGAYAETSILRHLARRRSSRRAPYNPQSAVRTRNPYGLTPVELSREIHRRLAEGWQPWEIDARFGRAA